jgi:hypothetical protein
MNLHAKRKTKELQHYTMKLMSCSKSSKQKWFCQILHQFLPISHHIDETVSKYETEITHIVIQKLTKLPPHRYD